MKSPISIYELSGGGSVSVLKPFSAENYSAIVRMKGRYPDVGHVARNQDRDEFIYIVEGEVKIVLNGEQSVLSAGESISLPDGSSYTIEGETVSLVMVCDQKGGGTVIEKE